MLEDKLLVWRFNRGDREVLHRIYEKYKNDLLKVAAALLEDRSAVEDVLHDVFVSFAQTAGNFRLNGSLKGYLAICIANRARNINRAVHRQSAFPLDNASPIVSNTTSPEHSIVSDELTMILDRAMRELPYEQQEVIVLHIQSNLKFKQIALNYDLSVSTVQSRYRNGMAKLRSILNGTLKNENR